MRLWFFKITLLITSFITDTFSSPDHIKNYSPKLLLPSLQIIQQHTCDSAIQKNNPKTIEHLNKADLIFDLLTPDESLPFDCIAQIIDSKSTSITKILQSPKKIFLQPLINSTRYIPGSTIILITLMPKIIQYLKKHTL